MDCCIYDDILDTLQVRDKKVLHFKFSKSGQILLVDKTCFPRPGHKFYYLTIAKQVFMEKLLWHS